MQKFTEKTLTSKTEFRGNILNVRVDQVKLPDGNRSSREIVEHSGGVTVLPVTKEKEIIMVKQFRKPTGEVLLELPAGKLESGEKPKKCAERELLEETGFKADKMVKVLSFYTSPGYSNELLHLYTGEVSKVKKQNLDQGEFLEVKIIKSSKARKLINSGKIRDGKSLVGLFYYLTHYLGEDN